MADMADVTSVDGKSTKLRPKKKRGKIEFVIPSAADLPPMDCQKEISGCWYTYPSEKYEFVSWDDFSFPTEWKVIIHSCSLNHQPDYEFGVPFTISPIHIKHPKKAWFQWKVEIPYIHHGLPPMDCQKDYLSLLQQT